MKITSYKFPVIIKLFCIIKSVLSILRVLPAYQDLKDPRDKLDHRQNSTHFVEVGSCCPFFKTELKRKKRTLVSQKLQIQTFFIRLPKCKRNFITNLQEYISYNKRLPYGYAKVNKTLECPNVNKVPQIPKFGIHLLCN